MPDEITMLPHSKEAEQGVLGAILHNNDAYEQVAGMLPLEAFFSPGHRDIFKAMKALRDKESPIDEITLQDKLKSRGRLEQMGGMIYILELLDLTPVTANVLVYADIVLRRWQAREMIDGGTAMAAAIQDRGYVESEAATFRAHMDRIGQYDLGVRSRRLGDAVQDFLKWMEHTSEPAFRAKWFIHQLDDKLGGISYERPTVVAARTGVGKTTLLVQTAIRNAMHGVPTLFFNLEMKERTPVARIIAQYGDLDGSALLRKETDLFTWDSLVETANKLHDAPLYIQSPDISPTMEQISACVHWHIRNCGIELVVIDHLSRFRSRDGISLKGSGDYEEQTARIMGLVELMRLHSIPVLTAVQIGRKGEEAPSLSDLKGSGDIEENSQVVLILHDENQEKNEYKRIEALIAKNGNGRRGRVFLDFWPYKFKLGTEEEPPPDYEREYNQENPSWNS